jgi:hypothetical protein
MLFTQKQNAWWLSSLPLSHALVSHRIDISVILKSTNPKVPLLQKMGGRYREIRFVHVGMHEIVHTPWTDDYDPSSKRRRNGWRCERLRGFADGSALLVHTEGFTVAEGSGCCAGCRSRKSS